MKWRPGILLLALLIPALVYAALKGILYFNAKRAVEDIVDRAADRAAIRYADISTDLRGAVTVSNISIQPVGYVDTVGIDQVRITSDDPLFFLHSAQWTPGENTPPPSLSFRVDGVQLPLASDILRDLERRGGLASTTESGRCADGLSIDRELLSEIGFTELLVDAEGHYRVDQQAGELEFGLNIEMHDIESIQMSATLTGVDVEALAQGVMPTMNLGGFRVALRVPSEFGRQALKYCAAADDRTVAEWSGILAEQALLDFERQGLSLGPGLSAALREFYRDWGEFEIVSAPSQPVGLLSLVFLPPERLAAALGLQLALNDRRIVDTSFSWQRPDGPGLAGLLGQEPPNDQAAKASRRPARVLVRREYQTMPAGQIARYIDHQVRIKLPGVPAREGLLKRIADGEAEIEQIVSGGRFTAYVPLGRIETLQVLVQRRIEEPR